MNAESRARLQDFLERASHVESLSFMDKRERIADCRLRREGDSWQAEFFHPTDEQRDALLFNLRLFIQDKDDISLRRLTELYDDPDISAEWKREHAEFRGELKRRFDRVAAEGPKGVLRHEDLFRMVLYGALAHRDADDASFQQYRIWVLAAARNRGILTGADHRGRVGAVAARRCSLSATKGRSFPARY